MYFQDNSALWTHDNLISMVNMWYLTYTAVLLRYNYGTCLHQETVQIPIGSVVTMVHGASCVYMATGGLGGTCPPPPQVFGFACQLVPPENEDF